MTKNKDVPTKPSDLTFGEISQDINETFEYCANRIVEIQAELKQKNKSNRNRVLFTPLKE